MSTSARLAPSSHKDLYAYIVAIDDGPQSFSRFVGILTERDRYLADAASVLVLSIIKLENDDRKLERIRVSRLAAVSARLAMEAERRGLSVTQVHEFAVPEARKNFEIPSDWEPISVIILGYTVSLRAAQAEHIHNKENAKDRMAFEVLVMSERWGNASSLISESPGVSRADAKVALPAFLAGFDPWALPGPCPKNPRTESTTNVLAEDLLIHGEV